MHEFKVKIDGLKKDDVIYLEPLDDSGCIGKIAVDCAVEQRALWKKLHKNCDGKGILSDKRWNSQ